VTHLKRSLLFALLLALAAPMFVSADEPDTKSPVVKIKIKGKDSSRYIAVGPRGVGACKDPTVCGNKITFRWLRPKNGGVQIAIKFADEVAAQNCFGMSTVTLSDTGSSYEKTVTANGTCTPTTGKPVRLFLYSVECVGGAGGDCGGVPAVDPAVVIERGG